MKNDLSKSGDGGRGYLKVFLGEVFLIGKVKPIEEGRAVFFKRISPGGFFVGMVGKERVKFECVRKGIFPVVVVTVD